MAGNLLGVRKYYQYTDDLGNNFKYLTDENLGTAVGASENDQNPDLPRRFKPRGVYVEDNDGNRKFLICPETNTAAYNSNFTTDVTIDGTTFKTTGRRGEQVSFGSNPSA